MTVPFLKGNADVLGPALASLTDTAGTLIDPNAKFQSALKMLFVEKPELMQQFVDIEKANPGTLKAFGFGDAGSNLLGNMQESIPALKAREAAPDLAAKYQTPAGRADMVQQADTGKTVGEKQVEDFSGWFSSTGQKLLDQDPVLFERAVRAKFGTGQQVDQQIEQQTMKDVEDSRSLQNLSPQQLVERILARGPTGVAEIAGILDNPGRKHAVDLAMQNYLNERDNQIRMWAARNGRGDDSIYRMKLAAVLDRHKGSHSTGSLAAWAKMMWGETLGLGPEPTEREMAVVNHVVDQEQDADRVKAQGQFQRTLADGVKKITDAQPEQRQINIDALNSTLQENGSQWRASWDDHGFFSRIFHGPSRIVFEDGKGVITSDLTAITSGLPPDPSQTTTRDQVETPDPMIQAKVSAILSQSPAEQAKELDRLQQADPTPGKTRYGMIYREYQRRTSRR